MGFVSSAVLHTAILIALALLTLSLPNLDVWSVDGRLTTAEPPLPEELQFDPGEAVSSAMASPSEDVGAPPETMPTWSADRMIQATSLPGGVGNVSGPVASVAAAMGLSREVDLRDRGAKGTAEFFGIQARGHAFVYVVDCSDSMAGARLQRALYELRRSVANLAADQTFHVIMFDGFAHPMFSQEYPDLKMLPANDANRVRFNRWLRSVDVGDSTRPKEALQLALYLEPDAIFLLSDGEFQDNSVYYLRENNPKADVEQQGGEGIPIHTICFESRIGEPTLSSIAKDHNGTFRFIP